MVFAAGIPFIINRPCATSAGSLLAAGGEANRGLQLRCSAEASELLKCDALCLMRSSGSQQSSMLVEPAKVLMRMGSTLRVFSTIVSVPSPQSRLVLCSKLFDEPEEAAHCPVTEC